MASRIATQSKAVVDEKPEEQEVARPADEGFLKGVRSIVLYLFFISLFTAVIANDAHFTVSQPLSAKMKDRVLGDDYEGILTIEGIWDYLENHFVEVSRARLESQASAGQMLVCHSCPLVETGDLRREQGARLRHGGRRATDHARPGLGLHPQVESARRCDPNEAEPCRGGRRDAMGANAGVRGPLGLPGGD